MRNTEELGTERPPASARRRRTGRTRLLLAVVATGALVDAAFFLLLLLSSSATGVGWFVTAVVVANLLPPVLLGPMLGWLVDRTSGRWAWTGALLVTAVCCLGVAGTDVSAVVVALAGLQAVASVVVNAAAFKLLPESPGLDERTASSYAVGMGSLAAIAGPPLGALSAGATSNAGAFLVLAGLAVVAGTGAATTAPRLVHVDLDATRWHDVWLGARTARSLAAARAFAPVVLGIVLITSMEGVAGVFYLQDVAPTPFVYACLLALWALGSLGGAWWTGRRANVLGIRISVLVGGLLMSLAILVEGIVAVAVVIGVVFVVGGFGNAVHNVGIRQLVYQHVPRAQQAQIWSMLAAVMSGTAALGNALGTPGLLGPARDVVVLSGAIGLATVSITAVLLLVATRSEQVAPDRPPGIVANGFVPHDDH
ncbi:MFS transporter [Isoptericola sediminis]|uniref:MFS transporter n=1 Tax=Isoptericola sediminis TaxID=2733572 RepID=A0A849KEZ0_9MICO|nr:MFS transporter [Isoptericola sediminis]